MPPHPLDGGDRGAKKRGYILVDAILVGQKQYPGPADSPGSALAFCGQLLQPTPLVLIEVHNVLLHGFLLPDPSRKEITHFIHCGDVLDSFWCEMGSMTMGVCFS